MIPQASHEGGAQRDVPALLEGAPCGFLSITRQGIIALVNETLAAQLEYATAELEGKNAREIMTAPTRIFYQTHFFPMLQMQRSAEEVYMTLRAKSGAAVHVLVNAAIRERGGVEHIDCILMRIRTRQKYEDQLLRARRAAEEANRSKVEFLSMMSHDLRTPLNAVNGYADLLLMGLRGPLTDSQRQDVERIKSAGNFLLGLINDVLSFARLELGRTELQIKPVPLEELLSETDALIGHQFREARIGYLRARLPDQMIVSADPERLKQILLNLLTNAHKFTDPGGKVTVAAERMEDKVSVRVTDTGRGIPPDRLDDVFKPFVQVDPSGDRKKGGVGLGLAICRELARSMDGDLTVHSELGRGSEFIITLPGG